jgi:3-hydroxybutyryl-CoA dehydrogenase
MEIRNVAVAGAGVMGSGIAQVSAMAGYKTILFDISDEQLERAKSAIEKNLDKGIERGKLTEEVKVKALSNLSFTSDITTCKADLVVEAILEKLEIKKTLFTQLHEVNGETCIFGTNTSSIPITQIAASVPNPERVVGIHFFNPAHIMKLVEVVSGVQTSDTVRETANKYVDSLGKVGINAADAPGFIVNRVARHFYVEGLKVLEENVATHESIDRLVEASGFKMGPFRLMDLIGVETNFSVTSSMFDLFNQDGKFRPSRIQKQKVDAGHYGRKSGIGFYDYSN